MLSTADGNIVLVKLKPSVEGLGSTLPSASFMILDSILGPFLRV